MCFISANFVFLSPQHTQRSDITRSGASLLCSLILLPSITSRGLIVQHLQPNRRGDSICSPTTQFWQPWFGEAFLYDGSDQGSTRCSMARSHRTKSWGPFCWSKSLCSSGSIIQACAISVLHSFVESSGSHVWLKLSGTGLCRWGSACLSACITVTRF